MEEPCFWTKSNMLCILYYLMKSIWFLADGLMFHPGIIFDKKLAEFTIIKIIIRSYLLNIYSILPQGGMCQREQWWWSARCMLWLSSYLRRKLIKSVLTASLSPCWRRRWKKRSQIFCCKLYCVISNNYNIEDSI